MRPRFTLPSPYAADTRAEGNIYECRPVPSDGERVFIFTVEANHGTMSTDVHTTATGLATMRDAITEALDRPVDRGAQVNTPE
jgi:hypothetical protein